MFESSQIVINVRPREAFDRGEFQALYNRATEVSLECFRLSSHKEIFGKFLRKISVIFQQRLKTIDSSDPDVCHTLGAPHHIIAVGNHVPYYLYNNNYRNTLMMFEIGSVLTQFFIFF